MVLKKAAFAWMEVQNAVADHTFHIEVLGEDLPQSRHAAMLVKQLACSESNQHYRLFATYTAQSKSGIVFPSEH